VAVGAGAEDALEKSWGVRSESVGVYPKADYRGRHLKHVGRTRPEKSLENNPAVADVLEYPLAVGDSGQN